MVVETPTDGDRNNRQHRLVCLLALLHLLRPFMSCALVNGAGARSRHSAIGLSHMCLAGWLAGVTAPLRTAP